MRRLFQRRGQPLVRILRQLCIRFCKPADARQRLVEVGPDILKLDHQLVDVADQLFRPRIAQDFFDAFRNVEDIRGDVVIRQRRERLQDVVELRRDGGNLGHVVVFFDFLDRIRDLASGVEIHLDHELAGEQALGRQRCPQAVADQAIEIFFFGDVAVGDGKPPFVLFVQFDEHRRLEH